MSMQRRAPDWQTQHLARHVYFFETTSSTQTEARRLIATGQAAGTLIVARQQSAGRGRFGRIWHSPIGNLYLSFILQPALTLARWPQYALIAALALADAIEEVSGLPAQLKWPNDVLLDGQKVAGILAEVEGDYLILGVGVNVNAALPAELGHATSLAQHIGRPIELQPLLKAFVERFDGYYAASLRGERFDAQWSSRMQMLGQQVRVQSGAQVIEGLAERIDESGALSVRRADGQAIVCRAGEVTLRALDF